MNYRAKDFIMIRIPLLSENVLKFVLDESVDQEKKFTELTGNNLLMEAIQIASPDLYHKLMAGRKDHRVIISDKTLLNSLCKYAVRASSRTTPFGLFCGFTIGTFGDRALFGLSGRTETFQKRARADAEWIDNIVVDLEKNKAFMKKINVYKNTGFYKKGGRLINPYLSNENFNKDKAVDISASIRFSRQVEQALELCEQGMKLEDLEEKICQMYRETDRDVIEGFLWGLLENGFLISELRMPKANINTIEYLTETVKNTGLEVQLLADLTEIQALADRYNKTCVGEGISLFDELQEKMKGVTETGNYLQVDLKMQMDHSQIGPEIKAECEELVNRLARLSGYIGDQSNISEYKMEFLEKYGAYVEVPLLEMLDPELGIGAPAGYMYPAGSGRGMQNNGGNRNKAIHDLKNYFLDKITYIGCMASENKKFTDIDAEYADEDMAYMDRLLEKYKSNTLPDSFEMNFFVFASDAEEIGRGNYKIGIGPNVGSDRAGRTCGRFADMLSAEEKKRYDELYCELRDTLEGEYQLIEIQEEPLTSRTGNIIQNCNCSEYQVSVGCTGNKEKQHLELSDILVGVDQKTNEFYLKSRSLNKKVKLITFNMLNTLSVSNACRFVREISGARDFCVSRLVEGLFLEGYTYIPRITYKNVIISPKKWRFTLDSANIGYSDFETLFSEWRIKWKLPDVVCQKHFDHLLYVNLKDPSQVHSLYLDFEKNKTLTFADYGIKDLPVKDKGGQRYYSEFVIPFIRDGGNKEGDHAENAVPALETQSDYRRNKAVCTFGEHERIMTPGDQDWWYLKLYCDVQNADAYLCDMILPWCEQNIAQGKISQFFFIRYADPEFHIRLRIKLTGNHYMDTVEPWIREVRSKTGIGKISIHTYERELERYGGGFVYNSAEEYFYWDSLFVMNLLRYKTSDEYDEELAVLNQICILNCFHLNLEEQIAFFENTGTELNSFKKEYKQYTKKYIKLIAHMEELLYIKRAVSEEEPVFDEIKKLFAVREEKLKAYAGNLHKCDGEGRLTNSLEDILRSIMHMHCNRYRGDNAWERRILEFTYRSLYAYRNYKKYNR